LKRLLQPFVLVVSAMLGAVYAYLAWRLAPGGWERVALAAPILLIWIVPVYYWGSDREDQGMIDQLAHQASYLSMAWLSFALVLTLARDALLVLTLPLPAIHSLVSETGPEAVLIASILSVAIGALVALRGPNVARVDIAIEGLHRDLEGFRIAQISDLHVGYTIRGRYVERVVQLTEELAPDLIVLTGDMVDGPVERLAPHVAPLRRLASGARAFFILGNHDCYSGADRWIAHFREMGMRVLLNASAIVSKGAARMLVGGVVDPAYAIATARSGRVPTSLRRAGRRRISGCCSRTIPSSPRSGRARVSICNFPATLTRASSSRGRLRFAWCTRPTSPAFRARSACGCM
jgi:hypothetical protein